jgi:ribosomal protein S18 acetylase RimI-like enzyme
MSQPSCQPSGIKVADQVQANFIAYFRLFADLPGITFVEADMTWIVSQGLPGNLVLQTRLSGEAIEAYLDQALRQIGQDSDQIDWFVFPGDQPGDLGDRLVARGEAGGPDGTWGLIGKIGGPGGTWLWADLASVANRLPVSANFQVVQVRDHALLKVWQQINAEGFGGGDYQIFYDAFARHGFEPDANALHYLGYLADQPVTSATLLLAGGIASVFNVSTPARLRRQGFGSAITAAAFQAAQKRGYHAAYIWSSPLGQGVYRQLGFATADFGIREYQWQKHRNF